MTLRDVLFGRPIPSEEGGRQRIGPFVGVAVLGLDAIASAAYGPEAALTALLPLGPHATDYVIPLTACVLGVLAALYASYRQTIPAYPHGGGSYTVAKENLSTWAGLLAGASLSLDYVLNVAVAISAGVGALVSAIPELLPHTLAIALGVLAFLTVINLRGIRDTGIVFSSPTWLFVGTMFTTIAIGLVKTVLAGGAATPVVSHPPPPSATAGSAGVWLLARAFASGCTAMTGVEAVSNGVPLFRDTRAAERTLRLIVSILMVLLAGVAWLCRAYRIGATPPGQPGYESVLSQLVAAVAGRGVFYYVTVGSMMAVLGLSANTSFADFPRLLRMMADDKYLPGAFTRQNRRLAFGHGIATLSVLAGTLLVMFGGITDRLIPLFAVGAFMAFTLSQAGMVAHWRARSGTGARIREVVNAVGALATAATLVVILVSKFVEGAWISLLLIPATLLMLWRVRRHEEAVARATALERPLTLDHLMPPIVVVPLRSWDRMTEKGLRIAVQLSDEVHAVQVLTGEADDGLRDRWSALVEEPARRAGVPIPRLDLVPSRYRQLVAPIMKYIAELRLANPGRQLAVVIPELIEHRWYHYIFRHHMAAVLSAVLLWKGDPRVIVIHTPWYVDD